MEKPGRDSRWNTLRALRILRRAEAQTSAGPGHAFEHPAQEWRRRIVARGLDLGVSPGERV